MQNSLHSLTCKIVPKEKEIEGRLHERNRCKVDRITESLGKQIVLFRWSTFWTAWVGCSGAELTMRFNAKCYHATVAKLLKSVPLKGMKKSNLQKPRKVKKQILTKWFSRYVLLNGSRRLTACLTCFFCISYTFWMFAMLFSILLCVEYEL